MRDVFEKSQRTRKFVAERPQVEAEITRSFCTVLMVPISPKAHDINIYLEKLEMDPGPEAMSDALQAGILGVIPERISEMYVRAS